MDRTEQNTTVVSDLMDGQLRGEAFAMAMQQLEQDERSLQTWHAYHVVGDVLRSSDLATDTNGDFLARLRVRLQAEEAATGQAPVVSASPAVPTTVLPTPAANDSWFSWRATAGLLSVALVAAVGWNWVARPGADGQMAASSTPNGMVLTATTDPNGSPQVMLRDARLDQLIQAHRQFGGNSALQVPAGFLRNATYDIAPNQGQGK